MNDFKKFRVHTGLTLKPFSKLYGIPYRTIQNWEYGITQPPDYVMRMIIITWYNFFDKKEADKC